ncbi:type II toxin-antitoxin system death-on-curing family toxin [Inquilinus limosus]|uniref:type II toxin-antitoxin system death-on-curing family toxin n=1 Tax=Inquilinus limosus TaxID=171674 RepID=UPI0009DC2D2A|nr:type II toxin-antitoxin system death-on-curing family toxin [Inquilinus limosus]
MADKNILDYIHSEHNRWLIQIGADDHYAGQTTIGIREVLKAHFLLAEYFANTGEGLGGIGPKDLNLLHSALSRQFVQFGGKPKWNDRIQICATLLYGLIKNHPFHDANKRTAFLTSILHLQKIGRTPTLPHQDYEDFMVDIADNNLSKYPKYGHSELIGLDREIETISHFLKRNTREIDLGSKIITYNQLDGIIRKHGVKLQDPRKNRIDVVRFLSADDLETPIDPYRIAHIGFHGWTKEVSRKDIHIVRAAMKLDAQHGYDSQSFFMGVDDPLTLIKKYREPLRRLAFR